MRRMAKAKNEKPVTKASCPITKKDWEAADQKACVRMVRQRLSEEASIDARTFSSGAVGYGSYGKITIPINGVPTKCQVTLSVVVVGSKEAGLGVEGGTEVPANEAA